MSGRTHPNVVFIVGDNVGWGDIGCYGGLAATPRIDALAAQGLRFRNYNVETQCTPSRSALLTGRFAIRSGNCSVPLPGRASTGSRRGSTRWASRSPTRGMPPGIRQVARRRSRGRSRPIRASTSGWASRTRRTNRPTAPTRCSRNPVSRFQDSGGLEGIARQAGGGLQPHDSCAPGREDSGAGRRVHLAQRQGRQTVLHLHLFHADAPAADSPSGVQGQVRRRSLFRRAGRTGLSHRSRARRDQSGRRRRHHHRCVEQRQPGGTSPVDGRLERAVARPLRLRLRGRYAHTGDRALASQGKSRQRDRRDVFCCDWFPTLASLVGEKSRVPTDRPIDGVDASGFLLGASATTGRDHVIYYGSDAGVMSVKWKTMKVVFRYSESTSGPIIKPQWPLVFDLIDDPVEEWDLIEKRLDCGWVVAPVSRLLEHSQRAQLNIHTSSLAKSSQATRVRQKQELCRTVYKGRGRSYRACCPNCRRSSSHAFTRQEFDHCAGGTVGGVGPTHGDLAGVPNMHSPNPTNSLSIDQQLDSHRRQGLLADRAFLRSRQGAVRQDVGDARRREGELSDMTKAKIATDIPTAITMPDRVETRLGTLQFTDGFPDDATVEKVFDNLDFQHAVQAFLTTMPAASLAGHAESDRAASVPTIRR